jgi:hypothetical protein
MIEVVLDGKRIALMGHEKFLVQVGKGPKGSYKTRYSFDTGGGNAEGAFLCLKEALFYYRAINVGYGYKKRLVCNEFTKRVLAKQFS